MDSTLPELQSAQCGQLIHTPHSGELGKVKTCKVLWELEGGSEPLELENRREDFCRKRPLDPEGLGWA